MITQQATNQKTPADTSLPSNTCEQQANLVEELCSLHLLVQQQQIDMDTRQLQHANVRRFFDVDIPDTPVHELPYKNNNNNDAHNQQLQSWATATPTYGPPQCEFRETLPKNSKRLLNFQDTVAAAVYIDQNKKQRREHSVIVNGLKRSKPSSLTYAQEKLAIPPTSSQPDVLANYSCTNRNHYGLSYVASIRHSSSSLMLSGYATLQTRTYENTYLLTVT